MSSLAIRSDNIHWIDKLLEKIILLVDSEEVEEPIILNGGLSVSGLQHVGRLRGEIVLVNAIKRLLEERGIKAKQSLVLYTKDPWKGKPAQLNQFSDVEEGKRFIGWPLHMVPDPYSCCKSWVEHYWHDFGDYLDEFAEEVEVLKTHDMYMNNEKMKEFVKLALIKRKEVITVLNKYRGRKPLPSYWIPFEPVCESCYRIDSTEVRDFDLKSYKVIYKCNHCGYQGEIRMEQGKLTWRLEWVGIWYALNVTFEPFGKDHAMPGGSRDSCNDLAINVFNLRPPLGTAYEWVGYVKGGKDLGDMGSSDFIGFTPREWIKVAEPEVLRFLYLLNYPMKRILLSLERIPLYVEQYDRAERIYYGKELVRSSEKKELLKRSFELAQMKPLPKEMPFQLPYLHAVALVQTLPKSGDLVREAIKRLRATKKISGDLDSASLERIERRLKLAKTWLKLYAPEVYQIEVLKEIDKSLLKEIPLNVIELLKVLYNNLRKAEWNDEEIKEAMIRIPKRKGKEEREFFRALYLIYFGKPYGPRIAPYLSMLDKDFVLNRLRKAILVRSSL